MTRWFKVGTRQYAVQHHKSGACRKRELVLEELCRFQPVDKNRKQFAYRRALNEAFVNLVLTVLLIYTIFNMLGMNALWNSGSDLNAEIRKSLVDNDFDDEHNTFNEIANWEDWWNFAHGSLF